MRRFIRQTVERALHLAPSRVPTGNVLVLAYHNVLPRAINANGDRSLHIDLERFTAHLSILEQEAHVVRLEESLAVETETRPRVVITFDDAYDGAIRYALPQCAAKGFPCTVFVAPALLGKVAAWDAFAEARRWSTGERDAYLARDYGLGGHLSFDGNMNEPGTLSHLRIADLSDVEHACQSSLVQVGNHTMNHANLGALDRTQAIAEIEAAQVWIDERFRSSVVSWLAYPYGIPPRQADDVVRACQLKGGMLVRGGWMNPARARVAAIPRWNVPAGISDDGFRLRVRGLLIDRS